MSFKAIVIIFCVLCAASRVQGTLSLKSKCGCYSFCEKKYAVKVDSQAELSLQPTVGACQRGCRLFHLITRPPHRKGQKVADDNCTYSCEATYNDAKEQNACLHGCHNGCFFVGYNQPRVRVTIYVDDELPGGAEGDQAVNDPAFRRQTEARIISFPGEKIKIPASYFTNLPIIRESTTGCASVPRICESWLVTEPAMCAMLMVLFGGILFLTFWSKSNKRKRSERIDCAVNAELAKYYSV